MKSPQPSLISAKIILILSLAACQSAPTAEAPTPTQSVAATEAAEPVETALPTPTSQPSFSTIEGFDLAKEGLALEPGGGWDKNQVFQPDVFYQDGVFHMFYIGSSTPIGDTSIGYATSSDGLHFRPHESNPVLRGNSEYPSLAAPEVLFDGGQWVMYVNGADTGVPIGEDILRATAPDPAGPWTLSTEPVIEGGGLRPWDRKMQPATVQLDDEGYSMYYFATGSPGFQMGLAHSTDGISWTRYNDPATADRYEESDPVLTVGSADEWDSYTAATLEVVYNATLERWEMFYTGASSDPFTVTRQSILTKKPAHIGFAYSEDGVQWTKISDNPAITILENCWPLLGSVIVEETYYVYYDQNCGFEGIAVLRGTISVE